jgi:hypothetical protein
VNRNEIKNFLKFAFGGVLISQLPTLALAQILPSFLLNDLVFIFTFSATFALGAKIAADALGDRVEGRV